MWIFCIVISLCLWCLVKLHKIIPNVTWQWIRTRFLLPYPCFEYLKLLIDLNFCFISPVALFTVSQNLFAGIAVRSELAKCQVVSNEIKEVKRPIKWIISELLRFLQMWKTVCVIILFPRSSGCGVCDRVLCWVVVPVVTIRDSLGLKPNTYVAGYMVRCFSCDIWNSSFPTSLLLSSIDLCNSEHFPFFEQKDYSFFYIVLTLDWTSVCNNFSHNVAVSVTVTNVRTRFRLSSP